MLEKSRTALWRRPLALIGRLGWGLADQGVSSLTNFAVSIYVVRTLGAAQFGAFSLAYVTYSFVLNASRGLATDPLMVRFGSADPPSWRSAVAGSTGTATIVGLVSSVCMLGAAALLGGTARLAFLALGLTMPGLMLQDAWRYAFFAIGRGQQAFLNDLIWALALVPGLLYLRQTHRETVFWFVFIWGCAATVAAAAGPVQAKVFPWPSLAWNWVTTHRDLGLRYLAENTFISGASQLRLYGVGLLVGLAAVGDVQAASTLMGPFLVIYMGIAAVAVPEAGRALRRSPRHMRLFCLVAGAGMAVTGILWGIAVLIALPRGLGDWLLGPIWHQARPLVLPIAIGLAGGCCSQGATAGLRALGVSRRSLRAQIIASASYLVGGLAGAALGGAVGTVQGTAVALWIGTAVWWWQLRGAMRDPSRAPAGPRSGRAVPRHRKPAQHRAGGNGAQSSDEPAPADRSGQPAQAGPPGKPGQPDEPRPKKPLKPSESEAA